MTSSLVCSFREAKEGLGLVTLVGLGTGLLTSVAVTTVVFLTWCWSSYGDSEVENDVVVRDATDCDRASLGGLDLRWICVTDALRFSRGVAEAAPCSLTEPSELAEQLELWR